MTLEFDSDFSAKKWKEWVDSAKYRIENKGKTFAQWLYSQNSRLPAKPEEAKNDQESR